MPYSLINRKAGGEVIIDGKIWKLGSWYNTKWSLFLESKKKTLYIADVYTGATIWDKQTLEYVLNRRLYKVTEKSNPLFNIRRIATAKDLARAIRFLAGNIEKL